MIVPFYFIFLFFSVFFFCSFPFVFFPLFSSFFLFRIRKERCELSKIQVIQFSREECENKPGGKEASYPVACRAKPVGIEETKNDNENRESDELAVEAVVYEEDIAVSCGPKLICPSLSNHCPRHWMSEHSDLPGFLSVSEVSHDDFHSAAIQSVPGCVSAPAVTKVIKDTMNGRIMDA